MVKIGYKHKGSRTPGRCVDQRPILKEQYQAKLADNLAKEKELDRAARVEARAAGATTPAAAAQHHQQEEDEPAARPRPPKRPRVSSVPDETRNPLFLGNELSGPCVIIARAVLKELAAAGVNVSRIQMFEGDSVQFLRKLTRKGFGCVPNAFDGSSFSDLSRMKLTYKLLLLLSVGWLCTSWGSLANFQAPHPRTRAGLKKTTKRGLGLVFEEVPVGDPEYISPDVLEEIREALIEELGLTGSYARCKALTLRAYRVSPRAKTKRQGVYLHVTFRGAILGAHPLKFNLWVKREACLDPSTWRGRRVAEHPNFIQYQKELKIVTSVLQRAKQNGAPGSALLKKGGAAYGESSPQVMDTVTTIIYKIMGFKKEESCCDIGYGIGTTALIYNAARNNLRDE